MGYKKTGRGRGRGGQKRAVSKVPETGSLRKLAEERELSKPKHVLQRTPVKSVKMPPMPPTSKTVDVPEEQKLMDMDEQISNEDSTNINVTGAPPPTAALPSTLPTPPPTEPSEVDLLRAKLEEQERMIQQLLFQEAEKTSMREAEEAAKRAEVEAKDAEAAAKAKAEAEIAEAIVAADRARIKAEEDRKRLAIKLADLRAAEKPGKIESSGMQDSVEPPSSKRSGSKAAERLERFLQENSKEFLFIDTIEDWDKPKSPLVNAGLISAQLECKNVSGQPSVFETAFASSPTLDDMDGEIRTKVSYKFTSMWAARKFASQNPVGTFHRVKGKFITPRPFNGKTPDRHIVADEEFVKELESEMTRGMNPALNSKRGRDENSVVSRSQRRKIDYGRSLVVHR